MRHFILLLTLLVPLILQSLVLLKNIIKIQLRESTTTTHMMVPENEKLIFELSSFLSRQVYSRTEKYPKNQTDMPNFSYGGWGTQASTADGYGLPTDTEYIYLRGGIHVADDMITKPLQQTFDKSVIYDAAKKRISSLEMNIPQGLTTEFWLKKEAFDLTKTNKEGYFRPLERRNLFFCELWSLYFGSFWYNKRNRYFYCDHAIGTTDFLNNQLEQQQLQHRPYQAGITMLCLLSRLPQELHQDSILMAI